ncbi:MAG: aldo/keto reductase [Nocardiaceae bacterium]|nr:aldo/keto reductase [Nocardiaceae bacterium]
MSDVLRLNDGHMMPGIGIGLYKVPPEQARDVVSTALEIGYRSVDTAALYENEAGVGQAVRDSGLAREDVFVTTKLWNDSHGYENALRAGKECLARLDLEYIDLLLIHWPCPARGLYFETFQAMQKLRDDGLVRSIGVSNFAPEQMDNLPELPVVNQIELHPLFNQHELRAYNTVHGIATTAWSPMARGRLNDHPRINDIAAEVGRTPAQVILRWHRQLGNAAIPKSVTPSRMRENFDLEFTLTSEQMSAIGALNQNQRIGPDPMQFA